MDWGRAFARPDELALLWIVGGAMAAVGEKVFGACDILPWKGDEIGLFG